MRRFYLYAGLGFLLIAAIVTVLVARANSDGGPSSPSDRFLELPCGDTAPNYDQPRRFKGVWLYEFEGSAFLENETQAPAARPEICGAAWLDLAPELVIAGSDFDDYDETRGCYPIAAFEIEFVGRQKSGSGGIYGLHDSEVAVDRVIATKPLPPIDCRTYRRERGN